MSEELKRALEISLAEAERGEVTHYESVEELMKALGQSIQTIISISNNSERGCCFCVHRCQDHFVDVSKMIKSAESAESAKQK